MEDLLTDNDPILDDLSDGSYSGGRPVFLTVLCILTFVGTGLFLIYHLFTMFTMSALEESFQQLDADFSDLDDTLGNYYRWSKIKMYVGIAAELICLAGAILMFMMKKTGFYLYLIGQIAPLIVGFLTFQSLGGEMIEFQLLYFGLSAIFPVGFIILYGLNYKYLK